MDGELVAVDRDLDGRCARVDEPQVGGGDVLTEQQEGFYWCVSGLRDSKKGFVRSYAVPSSASVTSSAVARRPRMAFMVSAITGRK